MEVHKLDLSQVFVGQENKSLTGSSQDISRELEEIRWEEEQTKQKKTKIKQFFERNRKYHENLSGTHDQPLLPRGGDLLSKIE